MKDRHEKHARSLRFYLIGGLIYSCMVTAVLGAASWAFLSLTLPHVAP